MEKKPKAKKPLLPGALTTPIRISKPPMPPGEASKILFPEALDSHAKDLANWRKEVSDVLMAEALRKLQILYKHLDIETSDHIEAFKIASALAPGFGVQFKKGGHEKDVWNPILLAVLYHEVEKNRKVGESTVNVCRRLSKREWGGKRQTGDTLRNQYAAGEYVCGVSGIYR